MKSAATLGAVLTSGGVRFSVWAPKASSVEVMMEDRKDELFPLRKSNDGIFEGIHPAARSGSLYRYRVDGQGPYPDPASRFQPYGVHGSSQVTDPEAYSWSDQSWEGLRLKNLAIYELHVGTFTPSGNFAGVQERLPYLARLGITAIELMPIAEFAGSRNWGYDGVSLFAPTHTYGKPDDLRRLIDRAHALRLGVLLDVVYNHFGPDGNVLGLFSPFYFSDRHRTPWGAAVNLDSDEAMHSRDFFIQNALYWIHDYHFDGLRFDATHAMADDSPRHFLAELTDRVRSSLPHRAMVLIAEDCRNLSPIVKTEKEGGWGLDAVWSDDFHHEIRRSLAGDSEGYYQDYSGSLDDLVTTIRQGWIFTGQRSSHFKGSRGTDPFGIPLERFVFCIQNHDQVGNRAMGERLHHQIDLPSYRAASVLLLSVPETPLLFMGQEWGAKSPFLYFTHHNKELGKQVTEGRRGEFKSFSAFADPAQRNRIPDPQDLATYHRSRLNWEELNQLPHAQIECLYRRLLNWRKEELSVLEKDSTHFTIRVRQNNSLWMEYRASGLRRYWIVIQWRGSSIQVFNIRDPLPWEIVITTEDPETCPDPRPLAVHASDGKLAFHFQRPGALILRWKHD